MISQRIRWTAFAVSILVILVHEPAHADPIAKPAANPAVDPSFWTWKLPQVEGDSLDIRAFKGKYILLNFWGEWCATCVEEAPFLVRLRHKYGTNRLIMLGFLKSYDLSKARKFIRANGMDWPQSPLDEKTERLFDIQKFPTNLLIAPDGKIVMDGFHNHYQDFKSRMESLDSLRIQPPKKR